MILANVNGHMSGNVYATGGGEIAPTLMAGTHGYGFGYFLIVEILDDNEDD